MVRNLQNDGKKAWKKRHTATLNFCGSTFLKRAQRALWGVLGENKLEFEGRA
jgi:hypothetical protein